MKSWSGRAISLETTPVVWVCLFTVEEVLPLPHGIVGFSAYPNLYFCIHLNFALKNDCAQFQMERLSCQNESTSWGENGGEGEEHQGFCVLTAFQLRLPQHSLVTLILS